MRADPSAPAGLRRLREATLWVLARVQGRIFGEEDADAGRRGAVRLQARSRRDRGADGLEARAIRSDLARGLSPEQIAVDGSEPGEPGSTIYRWIDAGYGGISNMDLRRKVGYKLRKRFKPRREPRDPLHPWGGVLHAGGGTVRVSPGDGHRAGTGVQLAEAPGAAAPPHEAAAGAPCGQRRVRLRALGAVAAGVGPERRVVAQVLWPGAHGQWLGVLRRRCVRLRPGRAVRRDEALLLPAHALRPEGHLREESRAAQRRRGRLRPACPGRLPGPHAPGRLGAEVLACRAHPPSPCSGLSAVPTPTPCSTPWGSSNPPTGGST